MIAGPFGSSLTKDKYSSSGYKIYGQEQVIADDFGIGDYYIPEKLFAELQRYEVLTGDVLVSCVGTFGKKPFQNLVSPSCSIRLAQIRHAANS